MGVVVLQINETVGSVARVQLVHGAFASNDLHRTTSGEVHAVQGRSSALVGAEPQTGGIPLYLQRKQVGVTH